MKVGCQHCGASYSVADEKVSGRKVKLRCKKCGESIVLDNTGSDLLPLELDGESAISAESDAAPVWHVSIGDAAQGPYALDEIRSFVASGKLSGDALVYRDGWADWKPLNEVAALNDAAAPRPSRPPALPPQAHQRISSRPEPKVTGMGNDPFDDAPKAPSPRISAAGLLSGVPNEGTVQFSVDQIRALSAVSLPNLVSAAPSPRKPGFASGSGSGLIDVASMADLEPVEGFKPIFGHEISPLDTMSPMALPVVRGGDGLDFRTKVIAGVVGLGMVLTALVVTVALVTRKPAAMAEVPRAGVAPVPIAAPVQVAAGQPVVQPTPAVAVREPDVEPEASAAEPAKVAAAGTKQRQRTHESVQREPRASSDDSARHASKHGAVQHESDPLASTASPKPSAAKASAAKQTSSADIDALIAKDPERAPRKGGSASIDELLEGAVSAKKPPPKNEPEAKPASDLPSTPSRDDMLAALSKAKAKAAGCKGAGVAMTAITITGSKGRATSVSVSGVDDAAKSCVEKAVRSTPFPRFQKDSFEVKFPFKLAG